MAYPAIATTTSNKKIQTIDSIPFNGVGYACRRPDNRAPNLRQPRPQHLFSSPELVSASSADADTVSNRSPGLRRGGPEHLEDLIPYSGAVTVSVTAISCGELSATTEVTETVAV